MEGLPVASRQSPVASLLLAVTSCQSPVTSRQSPVSSRQSPAVFPRSVVLGMGDGSMTTLIIADPDKEGMGEYLKSLPSR